jgi:hypothetical protein
MEKKSFAWRLRTQQAARWAADWLLIALAAGCIILALTSCKKEKSGPFCQTCVTTWEKYYQNQLLDSQVKSVIKVCSPGLDTITQGTIKTVPYLNGTTEYTKVKCE